MNKKFWYIYDSNQLVIKLIYVFLDIGHKDIENNDIRSIEVVKYKAVFFDRDGTLTYFNPEKEQWRNKTIESWSGKPFELPYEKMTDLFYKASLNRQPWYKDVEEEKSFMLRYYKRMLEGEGITEKLDDRAALLFAQLWCNNDRLLYPDVITVLEYFKGKGFKMGVISDTSPSLKLTLEHLGIDHYFTSFTASSLVGASKPSPVIFNAALNAQGVKAEESIYVDDYDVEADGAREQGFTSFLIDRSGKRQGEWVISSLMELINYVESL